MQKTLRDKAFELCQQDLGEEQRHYCNDDCLLCGYAKEVEAADANKTEV